MLHPFIRHVAALSLALTALACAGDSVTSPTPFRTITLAIASPASGFVEGETVAATATVRDAAGAEVVGAAIGWSVSDSLRASVTADGKVTFHAPGTVTVTARSGTLAADRTVEVRPQPGTLALARVDGAKLPLLIASDSVHWNDAREYHEIYIEGGDFVLTGEATPRYRIAVKYVEYDVRGPAGARTYTPRLAWRENDFGLVELDAGGALRLTSEYVAPLRHTAIGVNGGWQVRFRIPGDDIFLDLLFRRD